jgi:ribonucleoside-diphosphate reductase alpha chain
MLAWELGCKGITVYRAGSREAEVLTRGAEGSAAGTAAGELEGDAGAVSGLTTQADERLLAPRQRPATVSGVTERVRTGHGNTYVTVNFDEDGRPFEVFTTLGKAGSCDSAQLEAISRLVSLVLRSGIDPNEVLKDLRGITCCPAWDGGTLVRSAPDAVALVLGRHLGLAGTEAPATEAIDPEKSSTQLGLFASGSPKRADSQYVGVKSTNGHQSPIGRVTCPDCSGLLVHQEGCIRCMDCGYNKCE